ncbi:hypothetical protein KBZ04_11355 [Cyanobium sp. N5-Cardenillas]|nr:hypothetical protein [Cyanobium sp. N5-Cardenillas]
MPYPPASAGVWDDGTEGTALVAAAQGSGATGPSGAARRAEERRERPVERLAAEDWRREGWGWVWRT